MPSLGTQRLISNPPNRDDSIAKRPYSSHGGFPSESIALRAASVAAFSFKLRSSPQIFANLSRNKSCSSDASTISLLARSTLSWSGLFIAQLPRIPEIKSLSQIYSDKTERAAQTPHLIGIFYYLLRLVRSGVTIACWSLICIVARRTLSCHPRTDVEQPVSSTAGGHRRPDPSERGYWRQRPGSPVQRSRSGQSCP